jgi:hypothetical protein
MWLVRLGDYLVNLCLSFLQAHRETDFFFEPSGVQLAQHDRDQLHFLFIIKSIKRELKTSPICTSAARHKQKKSKQKKTRESTSEESFEKMVNAQTLFCWGAEKRSAACSAAVQIKRMLCCAFSLAKCWEATGEVKQVGAARLCHP